MSLRVAILGATGVHGRHLVPRLTAAGYRVRALARRPEAAADIFDEASLRAGLVGCDVAINLATSLPGPTSRGDHARNDRLRREGTPIWVRACRDAGVPRILRDHPAPWRDVLAYVCAVAGSDPPRPGGRSLMPSFRVSNGRARKLLPWAPACPDYRAGLVR
jgi:NAD(P)-dependent dehydrogenase (short-subunit alcohol dehydrogenase family)